MKQAEILELPEIPKSKIVSLKEVTDLKYKDADYKIKLNTLGQFELGTIETPLSYTIRTQQFEAFATLLGKNINPFVINPDGSSALILIVKHGTLENLSRFLNYCKIRLDTATYKEIQSWVYASDQKGQSFSDYLDETKKAVFSEHFPELVLKSRGTNYDFFEANADSKLLKAIWSSGREGQERVIYFFRTTKVIKKGLFDAFNEQQLVELFHRINNSFSKPTEKTHFFLQLADLQTNPIVLRILSRYLQPLLKSFLFEKFIKEFERKETNQNYSGHFLAARGVSFKESPFSWDKMDSLEQLCTYYIELNAEIKKLKLISIFVPDSMLQNKNAKLIGVRQIIEEVLSYAYQPDPEIFSNIQKIKDRIPALNDGKRADYFITDFLKNTKIERSGSPEP